ncbi:MAG: PilC/PilY family type IV pilus protein [Propionivibrio sp.]
MDWAYMPDQIGGYSSTPYWYKNSAFNGVAYNPAITYSPPAFFDSSGVRDTTTYPGMDGSSTAKGADSSSKPNWKAVSNDKYGVQSGSTSDLSYNAFAFVIVPGEYCDTPKLRTCITSSSSTTSYPYPAALRWCDSTALTSCRATYDSSSYSEPRIPSPRTATIAVNGSSSTTVSHITVDGQEIISATTSASSTSSTVATNIRNAINNCTLVISGQCTAVGYSATSSGSTVTITAPGSVSVQPVVTIGNSGTMSFDKTNFAAGSVPGENLRVTITPGVTSYPYPGTAAKAPSRTDCAGTTCTYNEEMTNYANWWAYYHTRMQMMKTATSNAFSTIDSGTDLIDNVSRFRVGYLSINNNTSNDFLNINEFKTSQKQNWYSKLFAANPSNSTPLREALSKAGRLYAGKLNGTTLNGSTVVDPLQYSCQQNYTILSTDGFWNGSTGYKLNGSTAIGNEDAGLPAPYNDGGSATIQEKTSSLQSQTSQLLASTRTLQTRSSNVLSSTSQLLSSTGTLRGTVSSVLMKCNDTSTNCGNAPTNGLPGVGSSSAAWSAATSCTNGSGTASPRCSRVSPTLTRDVVSKCNTGGSISSSSPYTATNTDNGYLYSSCAYSWTTAAPAGACTYNDAANPNNTSTFLTATHCSYDAWSTPISVGYCTVSNQSSATNNGTVYNATPVVCSYSAWSDWADATATCTTVNQSTSGTYKPTAEQCQYTTATNADPASSCTTAAISGSSPYTKLASAACSYAPYSTWVNANTCTALAKSTSSPYTVGLATSCRYTAWSTSWTDVSACTAVAQSASPNYTAGTARQCQTLTTAGTSNTLADVAAYYYLKDLRNSSATGADATGTCTGPVIAPATIANDLCTNNVPANGNDLAAAQHMSTFTLGLGSQGQMVFSPTYWTDSSGDFRDIKTRVSSDPINGTCPWMGSGATCTWPTPSSDSINNIDDLWHAAVNGHGEYFSATDPATLTSGLSKTIRAISNTPRPGTAAAAAVSSTNMSAADNYVFSSYYKSVEWYGEMVRQQFNETYTGLSTVQWSAKNLLDCATTEWTATTSYTLGSAFRNGSNCYTVTNSYVSGASFGVTDTGNTAAVLSAGDTPIFCSASDWQDSQSYVVDEKFKYNDICYTVLVNYVSGATFGVLDETNTLAPTGGTAVVSKTSRLIYTKDPSGSSSNRFIPFQWSDLVSASLSSYFTTPALTYTSPTSGLSQFCPSGASCMASAQQTNNTIATGGAAGEALVNFLRGDRSNEGTFYRQRTHVLGDIVSSEGAYVRAPLFKYTDANYNDFKVAKSDHKDASGDDISGRSGMVYVGANDGMLHAFEAASGQEAWAYVPSFVLPNLYKLADNKYKDQHQYFVDATPATGDICPNAPSSTCSVDQWKTILVGGLNLGGKGYFALDVTDPANPSLLWEFSDANLGYSYGNPTITKLKDGTWVVLFASGYNNADGLGRLYIVNANTGVLIRSISTGVGSPTSPSGLARIVAHSEDTMTNNTSIAAYGGDLLGNLWRFNINGDIGVPLIGIPPTLVPNYNVQLLASFKDASGAPQPITARPDVTSVYRKPVIYVGTGRFLGTSDYATTQVQSFYAVRENYDTTPFVNMRTADGFVAQTMTSGTCPEGTSPTICSPGQTVRTASSNDVDWTSKNGWYIDFPSAGELSYTDPVLVSGTVVFTTNHANASSGSACGDVGSSDSDPFVYFLDYKTGGAVTTANMVSGVRLPRGFSTRPVPFSTPDGSVKVIIRISGGDGGKTMIIGVPVGPVIKYTRRVSWRELVNE